jgi:Uri superfamily endonuclease
MNDLENHKPAISASLAYLENDKDNIRNCINNDNNVNNDNNNNGSENSHEVINEIININNKENTENKKYNDYKENDDINDSCALDIIAVYLKGQKNIYMESKLYCQQILNILMLPAIFISALSSVLSLSFENFDFNPVLISSLNGFNTFLLSLISYLKLDAKAEAHRMSSDKFDNLQSQCEFKSGQVLLFDMIEKKKNLNKFLEIIEKEVIEIKSTNQFIIPERIRNRYIYTYSTNVFALVKELIIEQKIKKQKIDSITKKIKNYKNDIIEKEQHETVIFNLNKEEKTIMSYSSSIDNEEKKKLFNNTLDNITHQKNIYNQKIINITNKLKDLEDINVLKLKKEELLNDYLEHSKQYMEIDADFKYEIKKNTKSSCNLCQWLKT